MNGRLIREYNFEIEDAIAFGVDEAIMLKNIKFWIAKNQANNKHFYDGKYWTFNSANAFTELFPFWTQKQIRRIIKSLIDQEVLIIGNYNKTPYDRTRWYTINISMLPKENYDVPKWENGDDNMVTPIPYINTDNKPNKKTNNNIKELPKKEFKAYGEFKNVKLTDEQIAIINSYDIIVRTNGMNNKSATGNRVDWWWLNVWNWSEIKENLQKSQTDYSNVDVIMIDKNASKFVNEISLYMNLPKMKTDKTLIYTQQSSSRLFDQDEYWVVDKSCTVPTTDVVCLSYLLNKYVFSEITVACLDIEDREELFKTHPNWSGTWHKNVGGLERDYINSKVAEGKLKILEL